MRTLDSLYLFKLIINFDFKNRLTLPLSSLAFSSRRRGYYYSCVSGTRAKEGFPPPFGSCPCMCTCTSSTSMSTASSLVLSIVASSVFILSTAEYT